METRQLGSTDLHLTTIGLGTWAIGGPWEWGWGPQNDTESLRTIGRAMDLGINWIDTAATYGLGHSESIVGRAIKGRRDEVIVATKCGLVWDDPASGVVFDRLTAASVRRECEDSLRRLGTDVIDLYQIHWPNPDHQLEEAWEAIAGLKAEGKIRYAGVSNFSVDQMRRMGAGLPVTSLQPPYSMVDRGVEAELLPYCREQGIGVVAYSPMQAGLLTGAFDHQRLLGLPRDDWRRRDSQFHEPAFSASLSLVDGLRTIAEEAGRSLAELSLAWVLRRPEVTAAIVGARRPDQIEQTAAASGFALSATEVEAIEALLAARQKKLS